MDHGPQAPSIVITRMAATCGVGLQSAMASATNAPGDVHGGAGEQTLEFFGRIAARLDAGADLGPAVAGELAAFRVSGGAYVPGYGRRFHPVDPRAEPLLQLAREAAAAGMTAGRLIEIRVAVERALARPGRRAVPLNIDGATAAIPVFRRP